MPSDTPSPPPSGTDPRSSSIRPSSGPRLGSPLGLYKKEALATGERRCESISAFTSLLSNGVLHGATREVADALLEVLDVFLVGGGELVDLVCEVLVFSAWCLRAWKDSPLAM